jgi:hypothetical protein
MTRFLGDRLAFQRACNMRRTIAARFLELFSAGRAGSLLQAAARLLRRLASITGMSVYLALEEVRGA